MSDHQDPEASKGPPPVRNLVGYATDGQAVRTEVEHAGDGTAMVTEYLRDGTTRKIGPLKVSEGDTPAAAE